MRDRTPTGESRIVHLFAKSKVMKQIRDEGLPEYTSASTHVRIQQVEFDNVQGGVVTVPMQRSAAMSAPAAYTCTPFAALFHTAIAASEDKCMRICINAYMRKLYFSMFELCSQRNKKLYSEGAICLECGPKLIRVWRL